MHFGMKSTLKNNRNHTPKQTRSKMNYKMLKRYFRYFKTKEFFKS